MDGFDFGIMGLDLAMANGNDGFSCQQQAYTKVGLIWMWKFSWWWVASGALALVVG